MKTLYSLSLFLCAAAAPAYAGIIAADDFDTAIPFHFPYSWAFCITSQGSLPDPPSTSAFAPVGVGGTQGVRVTADFSSVVIPEPNSFTLLTFGGGAGLVYPNTAELNSGNAADYSLSMDYRAGGLLSATTPMQVQLRFIGQAGPLLVLGKNDLSASASFEHFSADLSSWSVAQGSWAQLLANPAQVTQIEVDLSFNNGVSDFGFDADNSFTLDNVRLESVPEPGAASLLLTGAAACWLRWRRTRTSNY